MKLSLAAKFAIVSSALVVLSTGIVGLMVYAGSRDFLIRSSEEHLAHDTEVAAARLRERWWRASAAT